MQKSYENFTSLYESALRDVCTNFEHSNSPRGHAEREIIGYRSRLEDPRARFCLNSKRRQNIVFNYAEALWYLSGKNDLEFIAWYAPSMQRYSPDGISLPGTGYGKRLLNFGDHNLNQIERAVDLLLNDDADSKRVVLQIFSAEEDLYRKNIDVSCTLGLQLLLRDGYLHMVGFMRANDAYVGMLNDVFSFTFLQEYLATRIGCKLGHYTHQVGSIHVYDSTYDQAMTMLDNREIIPISSSAPSMPANTTAKTIDTVLAYEAQIRCGKLDMNGISQLDISPFWSDILKLFFIYREIKVGLPLSRDNLTTLNSFYSPFLTNRWGA